MGKLFTLGGAMVAAIILFGLLHGLAAWRFDAGIGFIFWGLATAFVAFLVGGGVGMLFGLPTARRVEFSAAPGQPSTPGAPATTDISTGYVESTSLEQIADFLVKGLVALSLTTFSLWTERFDTLSANVTATIMGQPIDCPPLRVGATVCAPDRVPGGLLLAGFALLGFLIAYLWMRRWFIAEMVTARSEEKRIAQGEQQRVDEAKADGRVGTGTSSANNPDASQMVAAKLAASAVKTVGPDAHVSAEAIRATTTTPQDSDDPWKGAFGGSAAASGCVLSANVSPLVSDPNNFQVDLLVTVSEGARQTELAGRIAHYYLHPSFGSEPRDVTIDKDGRAPLQIFSYGGFTVGVLIDDGTRLELDLAQIPGAPEKFVIR